MQKTELGAIAIFRHEFRIESDDVMFGEFATILLQLVKRVYGLVLQRYAVLSIC